MNEPARNKCRPDAFDGVPLFPLPDVVFFPHAILPLHIFESRYRAMTTDAIATGTPIAMALLRPGWEASYDASPEVDPVVCVGRIVKHERFADGRFNLLLEGVARARIDSPNECRETSGNSPYRIARLSPLVESRGLEIDLEHHRMRLRGVLERAAEPQMPVIAQFRELLDGATNTSTIADLLSFHLLENISLKQRLLTEADVASRIERLIDALSVQLLTDGLAIDPDLN